MARRHREATGGYVYRLLNWAVGRATVFGTAKDYAALERSAGGRAVRPGSVVRYGCGRFEFRSRALPRDPMFA